MRVIYKIRKHQWSGIIEIKTRELMMYIDKRLDYFDFNFLRTNIL